MTRESALSPQDVAAGLNYETQSGLHTYHNCPGCNAAAVCVGGAWGGCRGERCLRCWVRAYDALVFPAADPTLLGLRRAVMAQPEEDTPRLAYADRLDELGVHPEHARLVRAQVAGDEPPLTISRYVNGWSGWDVRGGNARCKALTPGERRRGLRQAASKVLGGLGVNEVVVARGFAESVHVVNPFPRLARFVFRHQPVTRVTASTGYVSHSLGDGGSVRQGAFPGQFCPDWVAADLCVFRDYEESYRRCLAYGRAQAAADLTGALPWCC